THALATNRTQRRDIEGRQPGCEDDVRPLGPNAPEDLGGKAPQPDRPASPQVPPQAASNRPAFVGPAHVADSDRHIKRPCRIRQVVADVRRFGTADDEQARHLHASTPVVTASKAVAIPRAAASTPYGATLARHQLRTSSRPASSRARTMPPASASSESARQTTPVRASIRSGAQPT